DNDETSEVSGNDDHDLSEDEVSIEQFTAPNLMTMIINQIFEILTQILTLTIRGYFCGYSNIR
ncbi:hypothetical protein RhiirA4_492724, partial [Rhizophagus irregularis]